MNRNDFIVLIVGFLSLGLIADPGYAQQTDLSDLRNRFIEYSSIHSVTGRESGFIDFIESQLPEGVVSEIDNFYSLQVKIGSGDPDIIFITSVDEPGYVVSKISDDGLLKVQFPSGRSPNPLFHQFHEGHLVKIYTSAGPVNGIIAIPSTHIFRAIKPNLELNDIMIDVGATSKTEAEGMGIQVLDPVAAIKDIASLASNRVAGPMISRKTGAFAMLTALLELEVPKDKSIVFVWAAQGYRRNSGASRIAAQYDPKTLIVISPFTIRQNRETREVLYPLDILDSGMIMNFDYLVSPGGSAVTNDLVRILQEGKVKTKKSISGTMNEVNAFRRSKAAILPVSIPVRNQGSLVEVIDLDDLAELIKFIKTVAAR